MIAVVCIFLWYNFIHCLFPLQAQCIDDEYTFDDIIYSLDYRPIDGDVSRPQNAFCTADFLPHGGLMSELFIYLPFLLFCNICATYSTKLF